MFVVEAYAGMKKLCYGIIYSHGIYAAGLT